MKNHVIRNVFIVIFVLVLAVAIFLVGMYFTRIQSIGTIKKLTNYEDGYDLYQMEIKYDYNLDGMLKREFSNNQEIADAILGQALPFLPIHMEVPDYACSSFGITDVDGHVLMGRNYDFDIDTSALMIYCAPKGGYASIATAALDHVGVKEVSDIISKVSLLPAPFICLDGMNEKGLSIAVLMLDSEPVNQKTEKPNIFTTLAIRLVLDRAATTKEAVDLLRGYDMFSVSGGDYHFFVTDASGDGRILEYDCHSETRDLVDLPVRSATNFYELYKEKVLPDQYNGIYGHGRERYDRMEELFTQNEGSFTLQTAWDALQVAEQLPKPEDKTSNTQWSIVFNDTERTAEYVLRRNWNDRIPVSLADF